MTGIHAFERLGRARSLIEAPVLIGVRRDLRILASSIGPRALLQARIMTLLDPLRRRSGPTAPLSTSRSS